MTRQKINPPDKLLIPWHQVDTVMLDMDGTLLDLHYDNHFWLHHVPFCYARKLGITTAQAWSILEPEMLRIQGTLDWYSVDYWSEQLQLDITAMKANLADRIGFRPHAELFLETLTRAGKHCWLVTNAHPKSLQLKCQITGIDRFFEVIISAHELGLAKEQAEFWQRLHSRHAFQASTSLLIDDSAAALRSAQDYGIRHLLTIVQPDSSVAGNHDHTFSAIDCFTAIMP